MEQAKRAWSAPQILWSAAIAVAVWTAIGFSWFGYGFGWMTRGNADAMAADTMREHYAEICVAQARNAPDAYVALQEFAALDGWKHRGFVESKGWAIMPGSTAAENGVARLCASKLEAA